MTDLVTEGCRLRIGEQLIRDGLITERQLGEALQRQQQTGAKIVATLIALGHLDQGSFLKFLARQPGVASIHLSGYDIPYPILKLVPAEFARKHEILPMDIMGKVLTVGMVCPLDISVIRELEALTQKRVHALLVAPEAIQSSLDKYYPDRSGMPDPAFTFLNAAPTPAALKQVEATLTLDGVVALVRGLSALPAMPDTVQRVREAVEDTAMGAADVAEILKRDPALAAKIISLANAPAHGLRHQIVSIEAATAMLGLREVYTVTLAAAVVERFSNSSTFDFAAHWRRSGLCGTLAKILARATGRNYGTGVYAAGLLHDLGRAVLAEVAPAPYGALDHGTSDDALIQQEHDTFGIAHPEVGYIVSENWALPCPLSESIRFHHQPERAVAHPELVQLISLAAHLTDHLERPNSAPLSTCVTRAREFGIEESQLTGILGVARALRDSSNV